MSTFETSLEASILSIGRNPQWVVPAFPSNDPSRLPEAANSGVYLLNSPKAICWFAPREVIHAHGARVRVTAVDDSATYTVTLGEVGGNALAHAYAASVSDTAVDILNGLRDAINTGVDLGTMSGATIAYATAASDTITRSTGSWITDGVNVGDRVTFTHTATNANDGITYTVAEVTSATVLTLVAADAVTALAGSTVTAAVVQRPVVATADDRNSDGVVDTLTVRRVFVEATPTEVDDYANTFTTAVSATAAGALEFDEDAISGNITLYLVAAGSSSNKPAETQWILARNGSFTGITYEGLAERVDTAGFGRMYPRLTSLTNPTTGATVTYTLRVGPAVTE